MQKALLLLEKIPKGKVVSYKELSRVCKTSPRAIGMIMKTNPHPEKYPCYKVVKNNGEIGNYSGKGGVKRKVYLITKDGVSVNKGKIDMMYFYRFGK